MYVCILYTSIAPSKTVDLHFYYIYISIRLNNKLLLNNRVTMRGH